MNADIGLGSLSVPVSLSVDSHPLARLQLGAPVNARIYVAQCCCGYRNSACV